MGIKENLLAGKARIEAREIAGVEGKVRIRAMRWGLFKQTLEDDNGDSIALMNCLVDETDQPFLSQDDVDALPMNIKQDLIRAVLEVNGGQTKNG